ncbi:hypothetical protein BJ742DRAFT_774426 [Cladochytrium replicatum]|nr:hypothetical protein BJ742DRAFT_774426 [Cladochytrium replicatum]
MVNWTPSLTALISMVLRNDIPKVLSLASTPEPAESRAFVSYSCHRNAAWGHILISDALRRDLAASTNITPWEAFKLSERYRVNYIDHYGPIVRAAGSRYLTVFIPNAIFYVAALAFQFGSGATNGSSGTRFCPSSVYECVAKSFLVSGEKIRRVLGYDEGIPTTE